MITLLVLGLVILALLGTPLFLVLAGAALLGYSSMAERPADDVPSYMMVHMFRLAEETSVLIALPLFTFAGYLLAESKAPTRLVNLSRAVLGWMPGGLSLVVLVACSVFTAFSGATGVTVIALGGLLLPALLKDGYKEDFSLGLVTTSGTMGLLLPPSLAIILFGIVAGNNLRNMQTPDASPYQALHLTETATQADIQQAYEALAAQLKAKMQKGDEAEAEEAQMELEAVQEAYGVLGSPARRDRYDRQRRIDLQSVTIDNLFLAGILPSLFMLVPLVAYSATKAGKQAQERTPFRLPEVWEALREALWEAPIPVLILGGIYGGFFTVTDAAAVTAFYVLVVEVFIYRDIHPFRDLPRVTIDSLMLLGSILLILMAAMSFTGYLVDREVPARLVEWIESYVETGAGFLLILNLFLLVVGCLMDIFSATVVVVPLILPLAIKFGIHPVHLGMVFLTNLQIGFLTPPVGMGLFLASSRFEKPVLQVFRASLPFLLLLLAALLAITYVPWLSMAFVGSGRAAP
jgi:TRAP-type C4-dicarboxylate transport system permease large subunit